MPAAGRRVLGCAGADGCAAVRRAFRIPTEDATSNDEHDQRLIDRATRDHHDSSADEGGNDNDFGDDTDRTAPRQRQPGSSRRDCERGDHDQERYRVPHEQDPHRHGDEGRGQQRNQCGETAGVPSGSAPASTFPRAGRRRVRQKG